MVSLEDYKTALESVSKLTADFIESANLAYAKNNPEDISLWKQKALYITMLADLVGSMNGIRQIIKPPVTDTGVPKSYKPRFYNPDNG